MRSVAVAVLIWGAFLVAGAPARALALDCADLTPAQIEVLPPPGVCDAGTHSGLQQNVDDQCKVPRACKGNDDCATLQTKKAQNQACVSARVTINDTCFCGGNRGHRIAAEEAQNAVAKCDGFLTSQARNCTDCP